MLALAAGAGCGNSNQGPGGPPLTKAQYIARLKDIGDNVRGYPKIPEGTPVLKKAAIKTADLAGAFAELSKRLAKINPPGKVRRAHQLMIAGARRLSVDLSAMAAALRTGKASRINTAADRLKRSPGLREVRAAQRLFVRAGYGVVAVPRRGGKPGGR